MSTFINLLNIILYMHISTGNTDSELYMENYRVLRGLRLLYDRYNRCGFFTSWEEKVSLDISGGMCFCLERMLDDEIITQKTGEEIIKLLRLVHGDKPTHFFWFKMGRLAPRRKLIKKAIKLEEQRL